MSVRSLICAAMLALSLWMGGCSSTKGPVELVRRAPFGGSKVWLVSNRFHTSIAVGRKEVPAEIRDQHPQARYFVIGWGGKDLYMMREVKPWQWVTTLVLPTTSALHVIPVHRSLVREMARSEIIEFRLSPAGRDALRSHLEDAFARDDRGKIAIAGPGKLPSSTFYVGTERYHLPKTCNLWSATALRRAGVPMSAWRAFVADHLLFQGSKHGRVLHRFQEPADKL